VLGFVADDESGLSALSSPRGRRQNVELAAACLVILRQARVEAVVGDHPRAFRRERANHPHRVLGLRLCGGGDLDQRHRDRLADDATRRRLVPMVEPDRRTQLDERQHGGDRTFAGPFDQPAHRPAVKPLGGLVEGVPVQQETQLRRHKLEPLAGVRTVRLPQVLRGPFHGFPTEGEPWNVLRKCD
jgi:hypothetical protein